MCVLRHVVATIALAGALAAANSAGAADQRLPQISFPTDPSPSPQAIYRSDSSQRPVELGTGWYLRGDFGASLDSSARLSADFADPEATRWVVGVGGGYKLNNWLRMELGADYNKVRDSSRAGSKVVCPYQLTRLQNQSDGKYLGYLWDEARDTCSTMDRTNLNKVDLIASILVDLGTWSYFTPYVGAGMGFSVVQLKGGMEYRKTSTGELYSTDLTPSTDWTAPHVWVDPYGAAISSWTDASGTVHSGNPPVAFDKTNWNRKESRLTLQPAWSLIAGVSVDMTQNLKADLSWRYVNSGTLSSLANASGGVAKSALTSQQLRLGFRYMID